MPTIETKRLNGVTFTLDMIKACIKGPSFLATLTDFSVPDDYPMDDYKESLPYKVKRFTEHPEENEWEGLIIERETNTLIGDIGFKGGPDENGAMDLGYSILTDYQNKGYATEMVIGMIQWGLNQPGVLLITARCSRQNQPSMRVLEKSGFVRVGEEDNELYWEIRRWNP